MNKKTYKRKWGDKKDGRLIRGAELDTNHFVMPLVWPRRTDCEAFISENVDLTATDAYIEKKNAEGGDKKYSLFPIIIAALGKLMLNRPKMNRFYRGGRLYERYDVSVGFIVKKDMSDDGEEALAKILIEPCDTLETVLAKVQKEVEVCRSEVIDKSSDGLRILMKFPHFIGRLVLGTLRLIAKWLPLPDGVTESDIFFKSVAVTNLGSIRLNAGYHHLSNWGTNSFFVILGEKKRRPVFDRNGNMEMRDSLDIGLTIDERIADGFYFSRTIRIFKNYLAHPETLEAPFLATADGEKE